MAGLYYLASPFSDPDPAVRHSRFLAANRAAGKLLREGRIVFSPISHSVPIADALGGAHLEHDFWMRADIPLLDVCDRIIVLKLDGWEQSRGVAEEIQYAKDHAIPIEYMEPVLYQTSENSSIARRPTVLPIDAKARKDVPLFTGLIRYFPDALAEVARVSKAGNEQHHPGAPLHWDKSKSTDEHDALTRHLWEAGTRDEDGQRHSAKVAWRALAALQREIEAEVAAQDAMPMVSERIVR